MLFCLPCIHVDTDFRYQTQCGRFVDTMDLSQIHAANPEGLFSNRKFRLIAPLLFYLPRRLEFCGIGLRCQTLQMLLDLFMTGRNLFLIELRSRATEELQAERIETTAIPSGDVQHL